MAPGVPGYFRARCNKVVDHLVALTSEAIYLRKALDYTV